MKVLMTGSRGWTNRTAIERELRALPPNVIIIHGGCPTGADKMVDEIARQMGLTIRSYPADWDAAERMGNRKAAGPIRNAKMIREEHTREEPINLCIGFLPEDAFSPGTVNCAMQATKAGIKVKEVNS